MPKKQTGQPPEAGAQLDLSEAEQKAAATAAAQDAAQGAGNTEPAAQDAAQAAGNTEPAAQNAAPGPLDAIADPATVLSALDDETQKAVEAIIDQAIEENANDAADAQAMAGALERGGPAAKDANAALWDLDKGQLIDLAVWAACGHVAIRSPQYAATDGNACKTLMHLHRQRNPGQQNPGEPTEPPKTGEGEGTGDE